LDSSQNRDFVDLLPSEYLGLDWKISARLGRLVPEIAFSPETFNMLLNGLRRLPQTFSNFPNRRCDSLSGEVALNETEDFSLFLRKFQYSSSKHFAAQS
jgi:hypothetical protein